MKILIISSHPNVEYSFNHQLIKAAKTALEKDGHNVEISDLVKQKFDPVGGPHDFKSLEMAPRPRGQKGFHYQDEQKYSATTTGGDDDNIGFADDLQKEKDKVERADCIIHQFPLYWWSVPAIHKGWFDRILAYYWAYGGSAKALSGKKWMLSCTTGAPTGMYATGNAPIKEMQNLLELMQPFDYATPLMLGCVRVPMWFAGGIGMLTEQDKVETCQEFVSHLQLHVTESSTDAPKPKFSASFCEDLCCDHCHGH